MYFFQTWVPVNNLCVWLLIISTDNLFLVMPSLILEQAAIKMGQGKVNCELRVCEFASCMTVLCKICHNDRENQGKNRKWISHKMPSEINNNS